MAQVQNILVVDDDRAVRDALGRALRSEGYEVGVAADGVEALEKLDTSSFDVVLLDVSMPRMDGLQVCARMRGRGDKTPVLMLTARTASPDRVAGLDAGADDYVTKPFDLPELFARIRALGRRSGESVTDTDLEVGIVRIDRAARRCWCRGEEVQLTKTEFDLLCLLVENAGTVLEPREIYEHIWGYDFGPRSKNLAVYVSYLRRKLSLDVEEYIFNVRGVGYTVRAS